MNLMIGKKTTFVIVYIFCVLGTFAQNINGLLFSSSAERINYRTSMLLFDNKPLKLKDSFTIRFDLSIWDVKQFGYILRIINEDEQEINFSFVNFYGEDKMYLDFHSPITHKSVQIPVTTQDIEEKRWLSICLSFDLKSDRTEVITQDSSFFCEPIGLKNPSQIKLAFGLHGLNLDVPKMVIRNIQIDENGQSKCTIPLNEITGEKIHDSEGRVRGIVKNPEWMINKHYYWQERLATKSHSLTGIAYDQKRSRIIILNKDSITSYLTQYDRTEHHQLEAFPFSIHSGEAIYDRKKDVTYIYNLQKSKEKEATMAILNMEDYSIEYRYPQLEQPLQHHNAFLCREEDELFVFGGYANHSYSNTAYRYKDETDTWEALTFSGDNIYPRYYSAAGEGFTPSQVLIMGGIGNESGKQEHGGRHLYDLMLLDMDTGESKKLWELENVSSGFIPCSNLILNEEQTHFYTICYPQYATNSALHLYKFSIEDGSYEILSDLIFINSEQIGTSIYLFYNELKQEFYTVIKENKDDESAQIRIYSLLYPPVNISKLKGANSRSMYWLLACIPIVALLIIVIYRRSRSDKTTLTKYDPEEQDIFLQKERENKNCIYAFGEFTVFDKNGKDIAYRFSSKLRFLFALVLFHSTDDMGGVSTDLLTMELWPEKDPDSAKNIRGVTINKLRNILSDISGISLMNQNSKWYFSFEPELYCDYIESKKIIASLHSKQSDEDKDMLQLLGILKRGALFRNQEESWIDNYKREYENTIEEILRNYITQLYEDKKYAQLIQYSELYFVIDPLNEEVLKLYINAFQKIGKKDQAIVLYNKFVVNYRKSMGEDPTGIPPIS